MANGSVLETVADPNLARKSRGAFFTPTDLADSIAGWAVTSPSTSVLEPSCGEAEFLLAVRRAFLARGADSDRISQQVTGCELHDESLRIAGMRCAAQSFYPELHVGDFFRFESKCLYDAVIGNPPYVRFQDISPDQWLVIGDIMERHGIEYSALSSIWAPFVIHAATFLKEGGRMGFVLPAELLTVNYAAPVRSFFMSNFASISLVTFDERIFPEVQEEVVVLLAANYRQGPAECIEWRQCSNLDDFRSKTPVRYRPASSSDRWSSGLVSPSAADALDFISGKGFCRLDAWGSISLGTVTGNNSFFVLSDGDMQKFNLGKRDVVPLSPPGSRHLRSLSLTPDDMQTHRRSGRRVWLFYPGDNPSRVALEYIAYGENAGVNRGYKCGKRSPWWRVPITRMPDACVTYMNDYAPSLCSNDANVYFLNSVHGLYLHGDLKYLGCSLLPLLALNSVTALAAESTGRAYGGGLLKVEPREAASLIVPSPDLASAVAGDVMRRKDEVKQALVEASWLKASLIVDGLLCDYLGEDVRDAFNLIREDKQRLYARRKLRGSRR